MDPDHRSPSCPWWGPSCLLFFHKEAKKAIAWYATIVAFLGTSSSRLPLWFLATMARQGAPASSSSGGLDWIPSIGASYHVGVDGISMLLILLTTFLGFLAILVLAGRPSPSG